MNRDALIEALFEKVKDYKIDDLEVYIKRESSMNIGVFERKLEKYLVSEEENLSLRGIYNGKMGYSYTEMLALESLDELIDNLIQYAKNNENEETEDISSQTSKMAKFGIKKNLLDRFTEEEKIEYLFDLEKKAYVLDKRVKTISGCRYSESTQSVFIKNTKGLELEDCYTIGTISLSAVTNEGENMQTGYSHIVFNELKEEYKDTLIKEAVGDAIAMLGAKSIESGNYEVVLRNNVAADMFNNFTPIFLGSTVQKNLSLMKGKLDNKVSVEFLNLVDNPLMEKGNYYRIFDDEGTLTFSKYIIQGGVLKTFLHNNKSSKIESVKSTGNGFRTSHKASIGVTATNMYIEEGEKSLDEVVASMKRGIIITDIHGLHAGINSVSGDFSLSSNGLLVEDGMVVRPLAQITVAGNFYKMLNNIKTICNDTKFTYPNGNYFGSPSLHVGSLTIAGK